MKYLKSLWGALASATVLFPTASAFLNLPFVGGSVLKEFYVAIGTTFSVLALLIVLTFADSLREASTVRKASLSFMGIGVTLLFAFISIKTLVLYDHLTHDVKKSTNTITTIDRRVNSSGEVDVSIRNTDIESNAEQRNDMKQTSPFEVLALLMFSLALMCFTTSFTMLGIYLYHSSSDAH